MLLLDGRIDLNDFTGWEGNLIVFTGELTDFTGWEGNLKGFSRNVK